MRGSAGEVSGGNIGIDSNELIKREHPDVSPFAQEEAINRFAYVRGKGGILS